MLRKNISFNKNETEWEMENPPTVLKRRTLCFTSYKDRKLKAKLRLVEARKRKSKAFFLPFILAEGLFVKFVFYLNVYCIEATLRIYIPSVYLYSNKVNIEDFRRF